MNELDSSAAAVAAVSSVVDMVNQDYCFEHMAMKDSNGRNLKGSVTTHCSGYCNLVVNVDFGTVNWEQHMVKLVNLC